MAEFALRDEKTSVSNNADKRQGDEMVEMLEKRGEVLVLRRDGKLVFVDSSWNPPRIALADSAAWESACKADREALIDSFVANLDKCGKAQRVSVVTANTKLSDLSTIELADDLRTMFHGIKYGYVDWRVDASGTCAVSESGAHLKRLDKAVAALRGGGLKFDRWSLSYVTGGGSMPPSTG